MKILKLRKVKVYSALVICITFFSCSTENEFIENETEAQSVVVSATSLSALSDQEINCTEGKKDDTTNKVDLPGGSVNVGAVDDRTCYEDYYETTNNGILTGNYEIAVGSNHWDAVRADGTQLQPRIERTLVRNKNTKDGSYVRLSGNVTIYRVGYVNDSFPADSMRDTNGTYFAQAKGKHQDTSRGPADPAICLFIAKPVRDSQGVQTHFDIFREQILERGGSGVSGRTLTFLTRVAAGERFSFQLTVGFRGKGAKKRKHYADAIINGQAYNWDIPEPSEGLESGIRYGVYRAKGGFAHVAWDSTVYENVNP